MLEENKIKVKGKLIVLEGLDGCGKETQSKLLEKKLLELGHKTKRITFPDYDSEGSALVRMYLNGGIGMDPQAVNPYAASIFYSADRYISFTNEINEYYNDGYILISDRYTSSNILFQTAKMFRFIQIKEFIEWITDLEYSKLGLPEPDITILLETNMERTSKTLQSRGNEIVDIHENSGDYMRTVNDNAHVIRDLMGWKSVDSVDHNGDWRGLLDINDGIYGIIEHILPKLTN